jgi:hypothetical protein
MFPLAPGPMCQLGGRRVCCVSKHTVPRHAPSSATPVADEHLAPMALNTVSKR